MESPIKNQINTIFVHVSNLKESVRWYSELLGQPYSMDKVEEPVYNMDINHHTGLTLDAGPKGKIKKQAQSDHPLFNFHTEDIEKAYTFAREKNLQISSEITTFEDFAFFTVKDPDGNTIMICTG
ncbi:putative enzyme related to lactoylglutathione lyase [Bacillus tianshenii]|uniref:Enzyme related to lactoylglutathione lyase n=1 Tax=Sutcliffiella tianshenii TaxID=1463404 RepID=A0ABS2NYE3_9BACI|nr:VOC family protein [Bacillus tianshenii]MBM7619707.1 putative enzyme related to lactoylglutathione lyase [Bacillus tianshenii]